MLKKMLPLLFLASSVHGYEIPAPPLLKAALAGNTQVVESLIKSGVDVRARDSIGRTLLHSAVASGNQATVDIVLKLRPTVSDTDNFGANAMMWSIYGGNLSIVKKIRSLGTDYNRSGIIWVDTIGSGGYYGSPLNCAAGRLSVPVEIMQYLIDSCKTDVNERERSIQTDCDSGWIPLQWAVNTGDTSKINYLLSQKADNNDMSTCYCASPLTLAIEDNNYDIVKLLISKGARLDTSFNSECTPPVFQMWDISPDSTIDFLFNNSKTIVNYNNIINALLTFSIFNEDSKYFNKIIDHIRRDSIPVDTIDLLTYALAIRKPDILQSLFNFKLIPKDARIIPVEFLEKINPYFSCVYNSTFYQIKIPEVERTLENERTDTSLHILFENGFDFQDNNSRNQGFLNALKSGYSECIKTLMNNGFSFDCMPENDEYVLYALTNNDTSSLKMLLDAGQFIKSMHFLASGEPFSCSTITYALDLAKSQQLNNSTDTTDILTCALLMAARSGCSDLVSSLYTRGAKLNLDSEKKKKKKSDNDDEEQKSDEEDNSDYEYYDDSKNNIFTFVSPEYQNAISQNLIGNTNLEILKFTKKINNQFFKEKLRSHKNYKFPTIEVFDFIIKNLKRAQRSEVINNVIGPSVDSSDIPVYSYVLKQYRSQITDENLLNCYAEALHNNDTLLLDVFSKSGLSPLSDSTKGDPIVLAALILSGDTLQVAKYLNQEIDFQKYDLLAKCAGIGNYSGYRFILNKNYKPSLSELNKSLLALSEYIFEYNISEMDTTTLIQFANDLLNAGADPNSIEISKNTEPLLLRYLNYCSNIDTNIYRTIAQNLINKGAALNIARAGYKRTTPLISAIESNDSIMVKFILSKGANPNGCKECEPLKNKDEKDEYDYRNEPLPSPLVTAIQEGDVAICKILIKAGADIFQSVEDESGIIDLIIRNNLDTFALDILRSITQTDAAKFKFKDCPIITNAIRSNSTLPLIEKIIQFGANVNFMNRYGETPYVEVIKNYDELDTNYIEQITDLFIKNGLNINWIDNSGLTYLHHAAQQDAAFFITKFYKAGLDLNIKDTDGNTALLTAIESDNDSIALKLIELGADVNISNDDGISPLHSASGKSKLQLIEKLIKAGAEINSRNDDGETPLHYMIQSGMVDSDTNDIPTIDLLLKHGANVTNRLKDGSTILHVAASRGLIDLIKKCVKSGVDINAQDDDGKTPLINAIFNDKPEATCELILLGASVALKNEDGFYPIHFIADASVDFPCLSEILAKIKDIDATNEQGQTSLHLAAQKSTATFSQLLSKGASIKKKDQNGETALFYAAKNKRPNNVALCIENGIDVNVSNNSKTVPLIYAVKERDYPSVVLLLNAKADPNVQDDYEDPVLTNAAKNADYSIVVALLKAGARIDTSEFEEIQNSFYDTEKGDSIIALLKTPLKNLPSLPEIDLSSKDGFWWYAGTIPASQFKKGVCRMVSSEAESIDESEEMLRFSRYEIERYTKTNYLFEQNIQIFGDIVDIDETKYTVSRDSNQLYLYSENENDCKVFKYAGKMLPESWGNSTTDN